MHSNVLTRAALVLSLGSGAILAANPVATGGGSSSFAIIYTPPTPPGGNAYPLSSPQNFDLFLSGQGTAGATGLLPGLLGNTLTVVADRSNAANLPSPGPKNPGSLQITIQSSNNPDLIPITLAVTRITVLPGLPGSPGTFSEASGAGPDLVGAGGGSGPAIFQFTVSSLSYGAASKNFGVQPNTRYQPITGYSVATTGFPIGMSGNGGDFTIFPGSNLIAPSLTLIAPGFNLVKLFNTAPSASLGKGMLVPGFFWFWLPWTGSQDDVSASYDAGATAGTVQLLHYSSSNNPDPYQVDLGTRMAGPKEDWWNLSMTQGQDPIEGIQMSYTGVSARAYQSFAQ